MFAIPQIFHPAFLLIRATDGFFSSNYDTLLKAIADGNVYNVLTNPLTIGATVLLMILGIVRKSKKFIAFLFAAWGYGMVYHFSLWRYHDTVGNYIDANFSQAKAISIFFVGFLLVTFVLLYFIFRDE